MLLQKQQSRSMISLFPQQLNSKNDKAKNKYKQADAVNTMHITGPFIFWPVRILFLKVQVFCNLFKDSHTV